MSSIKKVTQTAVDKYIKNGGEITECKPGRKWKEKPPTQKSALLTGKKRKGAKKLIDQPKKSTPKRNNPEVVTLKQICEDLGITSYKVRKHFRAIGLEKPGKQWAWDKTQTKEINKIKKTIKEI